MAFGIKNLGLVVMLFAAFFVMISGLVHAQNYVPITLTNTQALSTPAPFQQMISFNPSTYSGVEAHNLGNIRFVAGSNELYSWCESNCSSSATGNAIFWVSIPSGISANSAIIINMTFQAQNSLNYQYDGLDAGEAPQLSPSYAQYDNGANVFPLYENFKGISCLSGCTNYSVNGIVQNNMLTISNGLLTLQEYNSGNGQSSSNTTYDADISFENITNTMVGASFGAIEESVATGPVAGLSTCSATDACYSAFTVPSNQNLIASIRSEPFQGSEVTGYRTGYVYYDMQFNYGAWINNASNVYYDTDNEFALLFFGAISNGGAQINMQWARARAYPPGGIAPSVSFGPLTQSEGALSATLTPAYNSTYYGDSVTYVANSTGGMGTDYNYTLYASHNGVTKKIAGPIENSTFVVNTTNLGIGNWTLYVHVTSCDFTANSTNATLEINAAVIVSNTTTTIQQQSSNSGGSGGGGSFTGGLPAIVPTTTVATTTIVPANTVPTTTVAPTPPPVQAQNSTPTKTFAPTTTVTATTTAPTPPAATATGSSGFFEEIMIFFEHLFGKF